MKVKKDGFPLDYLKSVSLQTSTILYYFTILYYSKCFILQALEMGAVETLIVWENLETQRITLKNHNCDGKIKICKILSL